MRPAETFEVALYRYVVETHEIGNFRIEYRIHLKLEVDLHGD